MAASPLTPAQVRALDSALRSAFPDHSSLARLVRMWLGESLDAIVPPGSLKDTAYNLINWAESQGRMDELIQGALAENPTNGRLRTLAEELGVALPPVASDAPAAPPSRPIMLQALLGSKSCTVSIMLGLALLLIAGVSSAMAAWFNHLLPAAATPTPPSIYVPTSVPSTTSLVVTTTATAPAQVTLTVEPTPVTPLSTPSSTPAALATVVSRTTATAVSARATAFVADTTATALAMVASRATITAFPATPVHTADPTPPRLPPVTATAGPLISVTVVRNPTATATGIRPATVPAVNSVTATAVVPILSPVTASPPAAATATPSPTLLPAGTPCPWVLPVSGYTGGVYARPAVGRRLGCSTVAYEVGVPAGAIQQFQRGYLFRDSAHGQVFVLVREATGAAQGGWRVYPDPLPASDADPGASLRQLLIDQPTVASDLGATQESPQARLQSGSQFHAAAQPFQNGYLLWADQPYPVFALYSDRRHWDAYNLP